MADDEIIALRAGAHPLRLRILSLLTGAAMSAAGSTGAVRTATASSRTSPLTVLRGNPPMTI